MEIKNEKVVKALNINPRLYKSVRGTYFIGRSDSLSVTIDTQAWAGLFNPKDSGVNLFISQISISGSANGGLIYLNSTPPEFDDATLSCFVSSSNTVLDTKPKAELFYKDDFVGEPSGGVSPEVISPIVPTVDKFGEIIIPPGGNILVYLSQGFIEEGFSAIVGFEWWEIDTSANDKLINSINRNDGF